MNKLFCDLKTDEEKAEFFLSGRGYETGVVAHSIQEDVAKAYHRCAEIEALRVEVERLRMGPHPAITHCDNCGCDWLDNGLNPVGCPYCELRRETERRWDDGLCHTGDK